MRKFSSHVTLITQARTNMSENFILTQFVFPLAWLAFSQIINALTQQRWVSVFLMLSRSRYNAWLLKVTRKQSKNSATKIVSAFQWFQWFAGNDRMLSSIQFYNVLRPVANNNNQLVVNCNTCPTYIHVLNCNNTSRVFRLRINAIFLIVRIAWHKKEKENARKKRVTSLSPGLARPFFSRSFFFFSRLARWTRGGTTRKALSIRWKIPVWKFRKCPVMNRTAFSEISGKEDNLARCSGTFGHFLPGIFVSFDFLLRISGIFGWMVGFLEIQQFPDFLETFRTEYSTGSLSLGT